MQCTDKHAHKVRYGLMTLWPYDVPKPYDVSKPKNMFPVHKTKIFPLSHRKRNPDYFINKFVYIFKYAEKIL